MHGGGVIRPAVADVHIKINAPLAMRNFHPSQTAEKALDASVSRKIHAAKAGRPPSMEFALLMRKLRQTKYTKVFYDVWTDARWIEAKIHGGACVCVWHARVCMLHVRVDALSEHMRSNHSINPVLYDPLDAILFNKANAAYGPAIATTAPSLTLSPWSS